MIEYAAGDILTCGAEALVNPVNCVGVMGAGLALKFKNAFPENFAAYKAACLQKEIVCAKVFVFETDQPAPRFIINFPTKHHWRDSSRLDMIEYGLRSLRYNVSSVYNIKSIAIPALGCGLGGLNWKEVRPLIEDALAELDDVRVLLFPPGD